jgi:hypothetical protein
LKIWKSKFVKNKRDRAVYCSILFSSCRLTVMTILRQTCDIRLYRSCWNVDISRIILLKLYVLICFSDKRLCLHKRNTLAMCESEISTMLFDYNRFHLWLWRADSHYRHQKWSALHHISDIARSARESEAKMINSYSWIHSTSDSSSESESYD